MRKVLVFLAVVFALALVGTALADDTNQTYNDMFKNKNVCKHCVKDKCDTCKPKCAEPCAPKCDTCMPCEKKCCKVETCKPMCDTGCKPKCDPCKEWEYPNPCRYDDSEMGRNGMSRRSV